MKVFITATGTDAGKTWLGTNLVARLRARGRAVGAVKPVETGCGSGPSDALALASTSGHPQLAHATGLHRGLAPVAPLAATLAGEAPPPPLDALVAATRRALEGYADQVVEGAGGLLVPYDLDHDLADLARALDHPIVLVAPDVLGTLSHVRSALESAELRGLRVVAVALTSPTGPADPATRNTQILRALLPRLPILAFEHADTADARTLDALIEILDSAASVS